ncbi:MAG: hypothetical protein WAX69_13265 [Victivallales bacterium]
MKTAKWRRDGVFRRFLDGITGLSGCHNKDAGKTQGSFIYEIPERERKELLEIAEKKSGLQPHLLTELIAKP